MSIAISCCTSSTRVQHLSSLTMSSHNKSGEVGLIRPYLLAASYEGIGPGCVWTLDFWESEELNVNSSPSVHVAVVVKAMKGTRLMPNAMKM